MADQPDKNRQPPPERSQKLDEDQQADIRPAEGWRSPDVEEAAEQPTLSKWHEPPVKEGSSRPVIVESWFQPDDAITVEPASGTPETPLEPGEDTTQPAPVLPTLPGVEPDLGGAWFTPLDAQVDALLAGAADTIAESHPAGVQAAVESEPDIPVSPETWLPSAGADTQPADESWTEPTPEAAAQGASDLGETQPQGVEEGTALMAASAEEESQETALAAEGEAAAVTGEPVVEPGSTPVVEGTAPVSARGLSPAEAAFLAEQRGQQGEPADASSVYEVTTSAPQEPSASQPLQAATPAPTAPPQPSPYEEVERKVAALRQRFNAGYLTREELQNELRSLMILDDDGRWWMLGLETNQWYYFDGRAWIAGIPPGGQQAVRGSIVPTETGMQEVVAGGSMFDLAAQAEGEIQHPKIEIDEDGMPLPARVPMEDLNATLVSPSTPFMETMRPSEAPTRSKFSQVEAANGEGGAIPSPLGSQVTQPTRPEAGAGETIRSMPGVEAEIEPGGYSGEQTVAHGLTAADAAESIQKPKPKLGEFPQPDYSAALGISRNRNTYVKWGIRAGIFGLIGGMVLTLIALVGMIGYYLYKINQYQEAVDNLGQRAAQFETTHIFNKDGNELASFSDPNAGQRESVPIEQISPWLIHATVSTENETFYTDPGFSVFAILRATYQNLRSGSTVSGASTITQQLARALVLETEFAYQRTTERKIVEIIVASEIKRKYSKNEILQIYLNEIFYGNFSYGIEAAAQTYFKKPASELNPAEAAFLAGLPQAPATYDPVVNREAAINRMNDVLRLMSEANGTGCITIEHQDQTRWAVPSGGTLCVTAQTTAAGDTIYYYQTPEMAAPEEMTLEIALVQTAQFTGPEFHATHPHFVNYVWQQLEDTYGSQAIYSAGYRVYTTLDETVQASAETAVTDTLANLQAIGYDATNASVVAIRPSDGAVLAMVGSADYYNDDIDGQVNVAFTAQQPGSSIKPMLYLTAFMPDDSGRYLTPSSVIWDVFSDFSGYQPTNYDLLYHGPVTVREAIGNSLNIPAVKTLNFVGVERFTRQAELYGITFPAGNPIERNAGLTAALGAVEVRLFDLTTAYEMLANNGRLVEPYSIVYIQDRQGNEIYRADTSPQGTQVVPAEYAYLITDVLSDNDARLMEFGRGWPMELQNARPAAVKTGTTNDNRDTWTVGYTPQLVVGVWVGNSDNRPMGYGISSHNSAAPIWNAIMEAAHAGQPVQQFTPPSGIAQAEVCNDSGAQPSTTCAGRTHWDIFASSAPPPGSDKDIYRVLQVDSFTGKLANEYCPDNVEARTFLAIDDATAYNWINNTNEGHAWALERNLEPPLMPPPSESCSPNEPRPTLIVSYPTDNVEVQGIIQIRGAISMPDFNRYEVRYGVSHQPDAFSQPLFVDTTQKPTGESILGEIDTRQFENGPYTFKITAIDSFGRSISREIRVVVNNPLPTPQPTAFPTPTLAPSPTPFTESPPQLTPTPPGAVLPPTLAPTLTPTWTLTPTPG